MLSCPSSLFAFNLVVGGMLHKRIAYGLGITEKTIKVHRAQVMQRMGALL